MLGRSTVQVQSRRQSVSPRLRKAVTLFLMGLSLLVPQSIWQPRTRVTEADVLMREEQGRSEDCLPTWRQTLLPANELAPGQRPRDKNERPRRCLQSQDRKPPWCQAGGEAGERPGAGIQVQGRKRLVSLLGKEVLGHVRGVHVGSYTTTSEFISNDRDF